MSDWPRYVGNSAQNASALVAAFALFSFGSRLPHHQNLRTKDGLHDHWRRGEPGSAVVRGARRHRDVLRNLRAGTASAITMKGISREIVPYAVDGRWMK